MKKKLITSIISGIIAACVAIPAVTHATTSLRDPNGDGNITAADSTFINLFLGGTLTPLNLTPLDFDQNGIVSAMDSFKVQVYDSGITNIVPDASANDPTVTPVSETLSYQ
ncbi:MAG: dockerin type I domain-containing protein [Ruminococcus sp.]|nr:dockerin type I domain-containing protein [Ruminococcus sp.]